VQEKFVQVLTSWGRMVEQLQQQQQRQQQQQQQQLLVLLTFRLRLHQCRNGAVSLRGAWLRRPKRLSTQQGNFYGHDVKTA